MKRKHLALCLSRFLLVQLTDISVGLMSARGMPLQAKRLISVGAKCSRLDWSCQAVVYNLDRWIV